MWSMGDLIRKHCFRADTGCKIMGSSGSPDSFNPGELGTNPVGGAYKRNNMPVVSESGSQSP